MTTKNPSGDANSVRDAEQEALERRYRSAGTWMGATSIAMLVMTFMLANNGMAGPDASPDGGALLYPIAATVFVMLLIVKLIGATEHRLRAKLALEAVVESVPSPERYCVELEPRQSSGSGSDTCVPSAPSAKAQRNR